MIVSKTNATIKKYRLTTMVKIYNQSKHQEHFQMCIVLELEFTYDMSNRSQAVKSRFVEFLYHF